MACLVRRRVGKGIQGACAPMAEVALLLQRGWWSGRRSRSTRSGSEWLADARDIGGVVSLPAKIISAKAEMCGVLWVADSLPPPPGWRFLCASRRPGMSPTPRSAKYPATHGCHHLRGGGNVRLSSSSPPRRRWGGRYAAHMALA